MTSRKLNEAAAKKRESAKPKGKKKQKARKRPNRDKAGRPAASTRFWESRDKVYPSLTAICDYSVPSFKITVRHDSGVEKSESFHHTFRPTFGMDVADSHQAIEIATKLADQLVTELKLEPVDNSA